jgi:hypothetical protein
MKWTAIEEPLAMIGKQLEENKKAIRVEYLPTADYNAELKYGYDRSYLLLMYMACSIIILNMLDC